MKTFQAVIRMAAILTSGLLTGCATVISGNSQEVSFVSNPEGATIAVDGRVLGKAPITMRLDRKSGQTLVFEKEGFKSVTMPMATTLNPWFAGNVLIGGALGTTTDASSGAIFKYSPSQYMVTLEPAGTTRLEGPIAKSQAQKVKEFIVVEYQNLQEDLRNGSGPRLSSLMTMLKITPEAQEDAITKIRVLSDEIKEIPVFADKVIDTYLE